MEHKCIGFRAFPCFAGLPLYRQTLVYFRSYKDSSFGFFQIRPFRVKLLHAGRLSADPAAVFSFNAAPQHTYCAHLKKRGISPSLKSLLNSYIQ